jgi:hypothetical protein
MWMILIDAAIFIAAVVVGVDGGRCARERLRRRVVGARASEPFRSADRS